MTRSALLALATRWRPLALDLVRLGTVLLAVTGALMLVRDWYLCTSPLPPAHAATMAALCEHYTHSFTQVVSLAWLVAGFGWVVFHPGSFRRRVLPHGETP